MSQTDSTVANTPTMIGALEVTGDTALDGTLTVGGLASVAYLNVRAGGEYQFNGQHFLRMSGTTPQVYKSGTWTNL